MSDLDSYRISADEPSADTPIVALTCDHCSQTAGRGDVRWWPKDYSPSLPELITEAERHQRQH